MGTAFRLGEIVMSRDVNNKTAFDANFSKFVRESVIRHSKRDWGDTPQEGKRANERALKAGGRLHSVYDKYPWPRIWVITESDRSVTTILFPSEY